MADSGKFLKAGCALIILPFLLAFAGLCLIIFIAIIASLL